MTDIHAPKVPKVPKKDEPPTNYTATSTDDPSVLMWEDQEHLDNLLKSDDDNLLQGFSVSSDAKQMIPSMGQEYRYRDNDDDYNQWYYDEYSGLYRQNARTNQVLLKPVADASMQSMIKRAAALPAKYSDSSSSESSLAQSNDNTSTSTTTSQTGDKSVPTGGAKTFSKPPLLEQRTRSSSSAMDGASMALQSAVSPSRPRLSHAPSSSISSSTNMSVSGRSCSVARSLILPWPDTPAQVCEWVKMAKQSKSTRQSLRLCKSLLATLAFDETVHWQDYHNRPTMREQSRKTQGRPSMTLSTRSFSTRNMTGDATRSFSSSSDAASMMSMPSMRMAAAAGDTASLVHMDNAKELVRQAMMRECLQLLKRLSMGQGIGKGGDPEAQFMLANCFGMGLLGLLEDHSKAFQWYTQASKQSHAEATYRTAVCFELGIGTRKDGQRAMMFYRKAAHLAHVGSMYKLGIILLRGYYNTTPMPREAISWLQRAANHPTTVSGGSQVLNAAANALSSISMATSSDDFTAAAQLSQQQDQAPHALHALAMIQLTGEVGDATSLINDPAYAMELLHQAAQTGYVPSQVQLGRCYEHGQWVQMDDALSIYWYARAAELGNPEGCLALSGWYLTGSTSKGVLHASDREAYLWARRAVTTVALATENGTIAKAHFALAIYTKRGIGVPKDQTRMLRWMRRAAALGHTGAKQYLAAYEEKRAKKQAAQQTAQKQQQLHHQASRPIDTEAAHHDTQRIKAIVNTSCSLM